MFLHLFSVCKFKIMNLHIRTSAFLLHKVTYNLYKRRICLEICKMKTKPEIIILDLLNPLINLRIFMSLISILENNLNSTLFLGHLNETMLCSILV